MKINRIGSVIITQDAVVMDGFDVTAEPEDEMTSEQFLVLFSLIVREWAAARILESLSDFPVSIDLRSAASMARWN